MTNARADARAAAHAIRAALDDPSTAGEPGALHVQFGGKRGGAWFRTWPNLPGLMLRLRDKSYTHALLPGWEYTPAELRSEMIADLEHFADTGEQPKVATR